MPDVFSTTQNGLDLTKTFIPQRLEEQDVRSIVVAIGGGVNFAEINQIASEPIPKHTFVIDQFDELHDIAPNVVGVACFD